MTTVAAAYPVGVDIAAPVPQGRLGIFFRFLIAIPAFIVANIIGYLAEILAFLSWFAIIFTGKMPGGLANLIAGALRWQIRVNAYTFLLTDKYPPFSFEDVADYPVHVSVTPQLEGRNRVTVFFRMLLAIPSLIGLAVVGLVAVIILCIAWWVALFTGSVPAGMHNFMAGFLRWCARFYGYAYMLTDQYPPFGLS